MAAVANSPADRNRPLSDASVATRVYVILLVLGTVVGYLWMLGRDTVGEYMALLGRPAVWMILALMLVADLYPMVPWMRDVQGQILIHWSAAFSLSLLLAYGPIALVLFPLMGLVAFIRHGGAPHRIVVNISTMVAEGVIASAILRAHGSSLLQGGWSPLTTIWLGLVLALVWNLVNIGIVITYHHLAGSSTSWWVAARAGLVTTRFWLGGLLLAPLLAQLTVVAPQMLALLLVVIIAIHHNTAIVARTAGQARTDPLTGLANRRAAIEALDGIASPAYVGPPVMVLLIDLDGFKAVNDSFGHDVGDQVLMTVAARLRTAVPDQLLVARLGGDEFVVVGGLPESAPELGRRIRASVAQPLLIGGRRIVIGCTMGTEAAARGRDPLAVIRIADRQLYRAKAARGPAAARVSAPLHRRPARSEGPPE